MSEEFGFMRGIVKREDFEAYKKDMQDPAMGMELTHYLEKIEPAFLMEARKFAEDEMKRFEDTVAPVEQPTVYFVIFRAIVTGFFIHKKAHDRIWAGIDENSTI